MSELANSAHVHAMTGTFVVPVQSPYDRQVLREHVERLASRVSTLTLRLRETRWIITPSATAEEPCAACAQALGRVTCRRVDDAAATCITCAMHPGRVGRDGGYHA